MAGSTAVRPQNSRHNQRPLRRSVMNYNRLGSRPSTLSRRRLHSSSMRTTGPCKHAPSPSFFLRAASIGLRVHRRCYGSPSHPCLSLAHPSVATRPGSSGSRNTSSSTSRRSSRRCPTPEPNGPNMNQNARPHITATTYTLRMPASSRHVRGRGRQHDTVPLLSSVLPDSSFRLHGNKQASGPERFHHPLCRQH